MRTTRVLAIAALSLAACNGATSESEATDPLRVDASEDGTPARNPSHDASAPQSLDASADAAQDAPEDASVDAGHDAPPNVADASLGFDCTTDAGDVPDDLACTGLYASWPDRTIAANVRAFTPGAALWSDGAEKSRFLFLPAGARIDTSDMNEWTFPIGTKLWKEFRVNGARIETRFLWKRASGWVATTYAWSQDGSSAKRLRTGQLNVGGTGYEIPSEDMCMTCHQGRVDMVLGFEAVGLSMPGASGLTMAALVTAGLVTNAPSQPIVVPGNATESGALAWLHANCGNACHNRSPNSFAGTTGLWMRLQVESLASPQATDTYATAINVASNFQPSPGAALLRIAPGNVAQSAIPFRDGYRDTQGEDFQMPPIDTHVVDTQHVALIQQWIAAMQP